jgi:hypothetical protein
VADAVALALALALALGATEEAALMGTALEPAVADALAVGLEVAAEDALAEYVCAWAAEANTITIAATAASIQASITTATRGDISFLLNNISLLLPILGNNPSPHFNRWEGVGASRKRAICRPVVPKWHYSLNRVEKLVRKGLEQRSKGGFGHSTEVPK